MRKRWIYRNGKAIEVTQDWTSDPVHHVMPDIQPYQSMVDGSIITSRAQHREHLKRNHLVEIGNEVKHLKPQAQVPSGSKQDLIRAVQQAKEQKGSRYVERQITQALQQAHELQRHRR